MKLLFFFAFFFLLLTTFANNNAEHSKKKSKRPNLQKNLKPKKWSTHHDSKTIALELDSECLGNIHPNEKLKLLMEKYPCLSVKKALNTDSFRHHGKIHRIYLELDDNNNDNCLEKHELDWKSYCIYDISYDLVLNLHTTCADDITDAIYYGKNKKASAWYLDMMDGMSNNKYSYPSLVKDGNDHGIDIWILDSGIYGNHNEFYPGQVIDEYNKFAYSTRHGTSSASIASGIHYGVSKGFNIHDYPVCRNKDGTCSFSHIDDGLHAALEHMKSTGRRSIINLSVGEEGATDYDFYQTYYDGLFDDIIHAGGIIVVSAGNDNQDACNYWFSYSDKVISVGAHDHTFKRSSFSNYGPCVDIYAPGSNIPAAHSTNDPNQIGYVDGTSFSAPMISGIVANLLYEDNARTILDIIQLLQSNKYTVADCPSGDCFGTYYQCYNSFQNQNDHIITSTTSIPTSIPTSTSQQCCLSKRGTTRLNKYCQNLSIEQCIDTNNNQYCYIDNNCQ